MLPAAVVLSAVCGRPRYPGTAGSVARCVHALCGVCFRGDVCGRTGPPPDLRIRCLRLQTGIRPLGKTHTAVYGCFNRRRYAYGKNAVGTKAVGTIRLFLFVDGPFENGAYRKRRCSLSAESSDAELTDYLWPVVREMVKTCIENSQNIIIEGCYIPFGRELDFTPVYLEHIRYVCLIFSRDYIEHHFQDILKYEHVVEQRRATDISIEKMRETNRYHLEQCVARKYRFVLIDGSCRGNPEDMDW